MYRILVVDDEPELRSKLVWAAKGNDREVLEAGNLDEAIAAIRQSNFDVVVTDLRLEQQVTAGLEILEAAKDKDLYTQVIVITAYGTPQVSVETIRLGAFDYLERNAPGTDTLAMLRHKINLALEFREGKLQGEAVHG